MAATIFSSFAVSDVGTTLPPTWMLLRSSSFLRHAEDRTEELAVEHQDALVALGHGGQKLLDDDQAPALVGQVCRRWRWTFLSSSTELHHAECRRRRRAA